jgi:hypothetical protein
MVATSPFLFFRERERFLLAKPEAIRLPDRAQDGAWMCDCQGQHGNAYHHRFQGHIETLVVGKPAPIAIMQFGNTKTGTDEDCDGCGSES